MEFEKQCTPRVAARVAQRCKPVELASHPLFHHVVYLSKTRRSPSRRLYLYEKLEQTLRDRSAAGHFPELPVRSFGSSIQSSGFSIREVAVKNTAVRAGLPYRVVVRCPVSVQCLDGWAHFFTKADFSQFVAGFTKCFDLGVNLSNSLSEKSGEVSLTSLYQRYYAGRLLTWQRGLFFIRGVR